ncbi:iron chelate uptake ABC transporter family permease subunit [Vibrio sp. SM6]|uniref:Iron chelate uptake ABC transporter family permease subunit n=1 Tax=Vibrio agarilyticus TaxID=2726741 RepID=A0A7X8TQV5_9VIBR|nr:iron chelate uptake ABC transporter family permease subunit [Vibrio agarilyticus]NLS13205.1 iron chelate uptake ABC transporter family permease subunit [Vibrio agarilyticus]
MTQLVESQRASAALRNPSSRNNASLRNKILSMAVLSLVLAATYLLIFVDMRFVEFAMMIRTPKLAAIIIAAFCIGVATMVFQSIINNRIVTPCLLGMNALYILIHTAVAFVFGATSDFSADKHIAFCIDVVLMSVLSTLIYGYLFNKTNYNILFVLLSGTVMATLFGSISDTLLRTMDPNEYDVLLNSLIAGFNNVNSDIIALACTLIVLVAFWLRKEVMLLDVITLGKHQAINLGVPYDKVVVKLLLGVTIFITIATALVGPISFLGLIIANVAREFLPTYRHRYLLAGSFLAGVIVLLAGQLLIEHVFEFGSVISVFINVFGGAYFLYLIVKGQQL